MSLGNLVAVVFGLAFGGALLMLSPAKAGAAMVGLAAAVTILRFPFWGLLLFALVATFMPYSTVNVGIRSTVSEAILALTWGAVLWHIFLSRLPPAPALRYRSTERMLLWLMLFTVLPFVVGQVSIKAEASGLSNWLRWLLNLSIVFLAGRLLVERKNRETLVIALLLGTLAMLLMSIAVTWRWWREARPEKGPIRLTRDNAIWLGSTGGILAALVSGLFDHYFSFAVVMIGLFWLLVGINLLEARRLFPERQPQPRAVGYRKLKRQLERGAEA
ncbi:hypothetical protein FA325_15715 [Pseudomonas aeruginosa]|nr:hypothetical protein [Pseudomonas aeruginosa]